MKPYIYSLRKGHHIEVPQGVGQKGVRRTGLVVRRTAVEVEGVVQEGCRGAVLWQALPPMHRHGCWETICMRARGVCRAHAASSQPAHTERSSHACTRVCMWRCGTPPAALHWCGRSPPAARVQAPAYSRGSLKPCTVCSVLRVTPAAAPPRPPSPCTAPTNGPTPRCCPGTARWVTCHVVHAVRCMQYAACRTLVIQLTGCRGCRYTVTSCGARLCIHKGPTVRVGTRVLVEGRGYPQVDVLPQRAGYFLLPSRWVYCTHVSAPVPPLCSQRPPTPAVLPPYGM